MGQLHTIKLDVTKKETQKEMSKEGRENKEAEECQQGKGCNRGNNKEESKDHNRRNDREENRDWNLETGIRFLQSKKVLETDPQLQAVYFQRLRDPTTAPPELVTHFQGAQRRLRELCTPGDHHAASVPLGVQRFTNQQFPGFEHVFVSTTLVQRQQRSGGLCFMHGPAVAQHYRIGFSCRKNRDTPMLNLGLYVKTQSTSDEMYRHIFDDRGGDSVSFLRQILQPGSDVIFVDPTAVNNEFERYGPALLSRFQVFEDFQDDKVHFHSGSPRGESRGRHAMVALGMCVRADGARHFLVQNWWANKQFVEMSEDYLKQCDGLLVFIKTLQTAIPHKLPTLSGHYFETDMLDKEEHYHLERSL